MADSRKKNLDEKVKAHEAKGAQLEQDALGRLDNIEAKSEELEDHTRLVGNAMGVTNSHVNANSDAVDHLLREVAADIHNTPKSANKATSTTPRFTESDNEAKSKRIQAMKKDAIRLRKESIATEAKIAKIEEKKRMAADKAKHAQEDAVIAAQLAEIESKKQAEKKDKAAPTALSPNELAAQRMFEELKRTAPPIPQDPTPIESLETAHDALVANTTRVSNAPQVGADDLKNTAAVHQAVGNFLPKAETVKEQIIQMKNESAAQLKTLVKENYQNDSGKMRQDQNSPAKKQAKSLTSSIGFFDGLLKKLDDLVKPLREAWNSFFDPAKKSKVSISPEEHLKHLQARKEGLEQKLQKSIKELDDFKKNKNFDAEKGLQLVRQQKALNQDISKIDTLLQSTQLSIKAMKR